MLKMDKIEVLSYIDAPSDFRDDTRYRAQAAAAAEFEACTRLKIYGIDDYLQPSAGDWRSSSISPAVVSTFDTTFSFSAWYRTDLVEDSPAQEATRRLLKQTPEHGNPTSFRAKVPACGQNAKEFDRSVAYRAPEEQASDYDLPNKAPTSRGKVAVSTIYATRTPEVPRPKTAPAGSVAAKPTVLRKRTHSACSSFESLRSVIPDSQETRERLASHGLACSEVDLVSLRSTAECSIPEMAVHEHAMIHRIRPAKRKLTEQAVRLSQQSETTNLAVLLGGTNTIFSNPQLSCQGSEDSNGGVATSSESTSMWSCSPQNKFTHPLPPWKGSCGRTPASAIPGINRTLHENVQNPWPSLDNPPTPPMKQVVAQNPSTLLVPAICSLENAIHAPAPPVGHAQYTTHLTTSLRTLATRLPLATFFRPALINRDINVLERGYWHLPIPVVRYGASPHPDVTGSQTASKRRSSRGKTECDPWTEKSFLQFWHAFAGYVRSGWSGWGVSIYREDPISSHSALLDPTFDKEDRDGDERAEIVLKVTCWGEILGHLYLLMWVLSDKRTEWLRMEWRDAREETVIKMGKRKRGGGFKEYGFKGGVGVDGKWGIIDSKNRT